MEFNVSVTDRLVPPGMSALIVPFAELDLDGGLSNPEVQLTEREFFEAVQARVIGIYERAVYVVDYVAVTRGDEVLVVKDRRGPRGRR